MDMMEVRPKNQAISHLEYLIFGYLLGILLAELVTVSLSAVAGMILYSVVLEIVLVYAAYYWSSPTHRSLVALAIVPIIRLIGFSLPLFGLDHIFWYPVMSVPLFLMGIIIMRLLNFDWDGVGINFHWWWFQIPIALAGGVLGYSLYIIRQPELEGAMSPTLFIFHAVVLVVCVGFLEEFLFRGIMQAAMRDVFGDLFISGTYVAALYTVLHIEQGSIIFLAFIFGISLVYSWFVTYSHSILGVSISHGIANVIFFLILPLIA